MKHLRYLAYVVRHKWFVMLGCFQRGLYWQGIIHDWTKFFPDEWLPYAEFFYGVNPTDEERRQAYVALGYDPYSLPYVIRNRREGFNRAWLKHQHRSPHHWQHWVLREDQGTTIALEMPMRYALEMLADWDGAGRAITGKSGGTPIWYAKNREKMVLHANTRKFVDWALQYDDLVPV